MWPGQRERIGSENVDALVAMGYNRQDIEDSLSQVRYDDVFATYLLLGRKSTDVSSVPLSLSLTVCVCVTSLVLSISAVVVALTDLRLGHDATAAGNTPAEGS